MRNLILGIAGGTGSGKSWLATYLQARLLSHAVVVSEDWYYKNHGGTPGLPEANLNFDHPRAFDTALLGSHLDALRRGEPVQSPRYTYATHTRAAVTHPLDPAPLVILEGILVLHHPPIRRRLDRSVFVDTPADLRLLRRLRRDAAERAIPMEETLRLYETTVRPMHERYVQPSAARAGQIWHTQTDRRFPARLCTELAQHEYERR